MFPLIHQSLLWWGLPLIGIPLLIHLINTVRHRRVRWAAMEFLIDSQHRHRTWILLKQLLLLLLRMTAIATLVLMLAQPILEPRWSSLLAGGETHHVVLLDDSYSMSDRWNNTSAFEQGKRAIKRLATEALRHGSDQRFSLLRYSHCGHEGSASRPDFFREHFDESMAARLEQLLERLAPSESAVGPAEALGALARLPAKRDDETQVVYLVSDFRAREWNQASPLRTVMQQLEQRGSQIHLVDCVDASRPNLGIADLKAISSVAARGVPLAMTVGVRNFGASPATNVTVRLSEDGHSRPSVVIENIPPGKTVTRQFQVQFATAGQHRVDAQLGGDAVAADNFRYAVVDVASTVPVLLVDGGPKSEDAYFVALALAPGGGATTGLAPQIEGPAFLRGRDLGKYASIFLLNVGQLGEPEVQALDAYVRAGGGVAFFLGELSQAEFLNRQLYRNGRGLFPVPLVGPTQHLVDRLEKSPDLQITNHPVFAVFAGERNSFVSSINVERYFAAPRDWSPEQSSSKVIARLRNGAPLAVEKSYGKGRVLAVLTKAAPVVTSAGRWNNWAAGNPSFVVALLEMHAYLASGRERSVAPLVGTPLESTFPAGRYARQVRWLVPDGNGAGEVPADAQTTASGMVARLPLVERSGFYVLELLATSGEQHARRFAVNVAPEEGDLATLDGAAIAERLAGVHYRFHQAQGLQLGAQHLAGLNLGQTLIGVLVALLLLEQLVAYLTSYHAAPRGGASR